MILSFIGLEGEPSYIDVKPVQSFRPSKDLLTRREMEVLLPIAKNYSSKEIAGMLYISYTMVSTDRKNIYRKANTSSVLELVQLALQKGWI